ncbi:MAG: response regulator transcription factor [Epsilonproteobacteria bacterium]|nr:response regulator transcription factor [Campylobacterota bacterium]
MNNHNIKILVLEDDQLFAESLEDFLTEMGFEITLCNNGECALDSSYEYHYDLLLLDVNVPKLNGFEVLQSIRKQNDNTPAIFLTSFKDKASLLKGFDKGADDYLKKPVDMDELHSRITALLRRTNCIIETIPIGQYHYHPNQKMLKLGSKELVLSKKLSDLLELLIEHQNQLVTKEMITEKLWEWDKAPSEGALRVYINELKKILGKEMIQNQKGLGYKLEL